MASFTWLVVSKLSFGVPNAIRPQVSLLLGPTQSHSHEATENTGAAGVGGWEGVFPFKSLLVSHLLRP